MVTYCRTQLSKVDISALGKRRKETGSLEEGMHSPETISNPSSQQHKGKYEIIGMT